MKNKITKLTLASMLAISNISAIEIGPTGSGIELSGFVVLDHTSKDGAGNGAFMSSEVEVDLDWSSGPVAFSLDIDIYKNGTSLVNGTDADGTSVEEAVITYSVNDNLSFSAGRMLSYLGFEAYDAPNLYQISTAYSNKMSTYLYDGYADGVSADYANDMLSVGIWSDLAEKPSFEYALAFTGVENLTAKYIYADYGGSNESKQTLWASYQIGKLLLAGEIAKHANDGGSATEDEDGWLIMGNYSITDPLSLTLRYSNTDSKSATATKVQDVNKLTVSPTYMITDDLAFLAEYSDIEGTDDFIGFELIYTF
jgi:hypothetical protein